MNVLFSIVCIIWLLSEVMLNRLLRSKSEDKQNADANSLRMIWVTIFSAITAAVLVSQRFYNFSISKSNNIFYVGLGVIVLGVLLRLWVIRSMGPLFTVDVTIRPGHHLKTDGFFSIIRHPSYLASLISFTGFGIALNNWLSLLILIVLILMSFMRRIQVEERVLISQFGDAYIQYSKRTKRLIPFIY